jgi:hypothetical protein
MNSIKFYCAHCGTPIELHSQFGGTVGKCNHCGTGFIAPAAPWHAGPVSVVAGPDHYLTNPAAFALPIPEDNPVAEAFPISEAEADEPDDNCEKCGALLDQNTGLCDSCELAKAAVVTTTRHAVRRRKASASNSWPLGKIIVVGASAGLGLSLSSIIILSLAATGTFEPSPTATDAQPMAEGQPENNGQAIAIPRMANASQRADPTSTELSPQQPGHSIFDDPGGNLHPNNSRPPSAEPNRPFVPDPGPAPIKPPLVVAVNPQPAPNPQIRNPPPPAGLNPKLKLLADEKKRAKELIATGGITGAIELLEQIQEANPDDQNNLLLLAKCHVEHKTALRAARFLKEYLAGHAGKEDVQNALGTALSYVDPDQWNYNYWACKRFYTHYDEELAHLKHNDTKRWGMTWLTAGDADQKWQKYLTTQETLVATIGHERRAEVDLETLIQQRKDARPRVDADMPAFEKAIRNTRMAIAADERNIGGLRATLSASAPPFPSTIEPGN